MMEFILNNDDVLLKMMDLVLNNDVSFYQNSDTGQLLRQKVGNVDPGSGGRSPSPRAGSDSPNASWGGVAN